ncbi:MAG: hypothetical protein GVY24_02675 [Planctomycetes bacterium]|jgi:hypothetical protein|nr:hypothetical protein [Planctomycetota bacterium]
MGKRASVTDIEQLGRFRARLIKFADELRVALGDADGEIQRTLNWLDGEAPAHWQRVIRKLHEQVEQAKADLRNKKLYKTPMGTTPNTAVEEKALRKLQHKLEHAQQKLLNTKRWRQRLDKEVLTYRGMARRAAGVVESTVPGAVSDIDRMRDALEKYTTLAAPSSDAASASPGSGQSMARSVEQRPEPDQAPDPDEEPEAER